jgi:hypothetical protein
MYTPLASLDGIGDRRNEMTDQFDQLINRWRHFGRNDALGDASVRFQERDLPFGEKANRSAASSSSGNILFVFQEFK